MQISSSRSLLSKVFLTSKCFKSQPKWVARETVILTISIVYSIDMRENISISAMVINKVCYARLVLSRLYCYCTYQVDQLHDQLPPNSKPTNELSLVCIPKLDLLFSLLIFHKYNSHKVFRPSLNILFLLPLILTNFLVHYRFVLQKNSTYQLYFKSPLITSVKSGNVKITLYRSHLMT